MFVLVGHLVGWLVCVCLSVGCLWLCVACCVLFGWLAGWFVVCANCDVLFYGVQFCIV